ncbi:MAG: FKBP-type peptidyl-prolyl cis-trans isomerase [Flavobacteriaceae bacterium]|jgi:FKBP-type peptidyl-prolyl cis-trans isomerase
MKKSIITSLLIIILVVVGIIVLVKTRNTNDVSTQKDIRSMIEPKEGDMPQVEELKIEILEEGSGQEVAPGDKVSVHYTGMFINGDVFDSSIPKGAPFVFTAGAGQVIKGWDMGLIGMKIGEKRKLTVPYHLGYGEAGYGPIPAKATLVFEIDLIEIQ